MSTQPLMQRVIPEDIRDNEPVPYSIFTSDGALLLAKGQVVSAAEDGAILRTQGWRRLESDEEVSVDAFTGNDGIDNRLPADARLPARGRPALLQVEALIADDVRLMRQLLIRLLREQGLTKIEAVGDGHKAIAYFFRYQPHMVFLDIDMPGLDGLAALKQIKQWSPECFVCMISANSTLVNVKEAKAHGVDAFLVKPVSPLNLKRVLALYHPAGDG